MSNELTCPVCGKPLIRQVVGTWIKLRCAGCGFEQEAHWVPPLHELGIVPDPAVVDVFVKWKGEHPSMAELHAVRKLVPALADQSLGALKREAEAGRSMKIGRMPRTSARQLHEDAEPLGLTIEYR